MRTLVFRLRQLTIAALLVVATIPAVASSAAAAENCFSVSFLGVLPGFTTATIVTQECGSIPGTTEGTFKVMVGGFQIAEGELTAVHTLTSVTATFEGEITATVPGFIKGQEFNGSLMYNALTHTGLTTVHFEDLPAVTVPFHCTQTGLFSYSCSVP